MKDRKTGWLTQSFHASFRETLLHALARYHAVCPLYCLMPDHAHILVLGWAHDCRQRTLIRFLRQHSNRTLRRDHRCEWQKQPYDNILREADRARDAFIRVANNIDENPERSKLVTEKTDWDYRGAMVPGYPDFGFDTEEFWDRFWKIYTSVLPDDARPAVDRT